MKIYKLDVLKKIINKKKGNKQTIVLVTGCFDVIHWGHIDYFRFAKQQGDILIVGLDNDESIAMNKGNNRPLFSFEKRAKVLEELMSIDYIFEIKEKVIFNSEDADNMLINILKKIQPDKLVCNKNADTSFNRKKKICDLFDIELVSDSSKKETSSRNIIDFFKKNA